ncbi:hypothetical protein JMN32_17930 [Fulvivirga sp. 29W222]|uniref:Uncharacterized protein n=1 Tax=Fulvivirga marina TaxID=2494733 RepID=A0A937FY63_9BACT|nr:hypothetical protein [Fulvivirga marina]MBL6448199.1 hypothetical protein [Fulvivirga marina]
MSKITCFKQTTNQVFELDTSTTLDKIRTTLTSAGFMPPDDEAQNIGYRFVAYQAKDTRNLDDCLIAKSVEHLVPLSGVLGPAQQLIITNEFATSKPDLMGIGVDWWFNRYVGAQVTLNQTDASAIEQNQKIGAFPPLMLTNVIPTSKNVTGIYDNVCVCVDGTVVDMSLSSWGAAGYAEYIGADSGEPVVDGLFLPYNQNAINSYCTGAPFRRWAGNPPTTIQIQGTDEVSIAPGKTLSYQRVTFKTARITHWSRGSESVTSNATPPPLNAPTEMALFENGPMMAMAHETAASNQRQIADAKKGAVVVPGNGIKPGTPTHGGSSNQQFGKPISVTVDPWTDALGEVVVYFFVFKSHADAVATINGINAPDPNIWN